jgi:hypothetical protein
MTARPKPPPEADVLKGVLAALRIFGIDAQRQNTGMAFNPKGQPVRFGEPGNLDISATLHDGRRMEIEVKRPGQKPTPEQWHRIHTLNSLGGVAFYVTDPEQVARILPRLLEGWRVEIDENGFQEVTDEPAGGKP